MLYLKQSPASPVTVIVPVCDVQPVGWVKVTVGGVTIALITISPDGGEEIQHTSALVTV